MSLVLLKKLGWEPIGISLKYTVWSDKSNLFRENVCCSEESLRIAGEVCERLGVPHQIVDVEANFQREVIDYFITELKAQRTPNPCVVCNRQLKFAELFAFAKKKGIEFVATGHYARIRKNDETGLYELLRPKDSAKDQTYYLSFLPQEWLSRIIFPLGDYSKDEVYELAKREGFAFYLKRKQSQDFCFVAGKSLRAFLEKEIGLNYGPIKDSSGVILGEHPGLHFYTLGQRQGLGLPGGPYFVVGFDLPTNTLIVDKDLKAHSQKEVTLSPFNFISGQPIKGKIAVQAKLRYRQPLAEATLWPPQKDQLKLIFIKPQIAVTPGQVAVFYQGGVCLGGGRIVA